jgi:chromosome segregation ATPase
MTDSMVDEKSARLIRENERLRAEKVNLRIQYSDVKIQWAKAEAEVGRLRQRLVEWEGKEEAARNAQAAEIGRRQKAEAEAARLREKAAFVETGWSVTRTERDAFKAEVTRHGVERAKAEAERDAFKDDARVLRAEVDRLSWARYDRRKERDALKAAGKAFLAVLEPFAYRFPSSVWNDSYDNFRQALKELEEVDA